jgi:hypothetical protein
MIPVPTSTDPSATPSTQGPKEIFLMMAAAQMHGEGRLVQPKEQGQQVALAGAGGTAAGASGGRGTWYEKGQLAGGGLQRLMNDAEGDEDLGRIVHSLNYHGLMVPSQLGGVAPIAPPQ